MYNADGGFRHVSTGYSEVWAISNTGIVYRRIGITAENPAGVSWEAGLPVCILCFLKSPPDSHFSHIIAVDPSDKH